MENQDAASEGEDQRQRKQHPISIKRGSADKDDSINTSSQSNESETDLESFQKEELSGSKQDTIDAANYSDTDEDEDEGLGDGNLGRSVRGR